MYSLYCCAVVMGSFGLHLDRMESDFVTIYLIEQVTCKLVRVCVREREREDNILGCIFHDIGAVTEN